MWFKLLQGAAATISVPRSDLGLMYVRTGNENLFLARFSDVKL
jgi:hypothetical protein